MCEDLPHPGARSDPVEPPSCGTGGARTAARLQLPRAPSTAARFPVGSPRGRGASGCSGGWRLSRDPPPRTEVCCLTPPPFAQCSRSAPGRWCPGTPLGTRGEVRRGHPVPAGKSRRFRASIVTRGEGVCGARAPGARAGKARETLGHRVAPRGGPEACAQRGCGQQPGDTEARRQGGSRPAGWGWGPGWVRRRQSSREGARAGETVRGDAGSGEGREAAETRRAAGTPDAESAPEIPTGDWCAERPREGMGKARPGRDGESGGGRSERQARRGGRDPGGSGGGSGGAEYAPERVPGSLDPPRAVGTGPQRPLSLPAPPRPVWATRAALGAPPRVPDPETLASPPLPLLTRSLLSKLMSPLPPRVRWVGWKQQGLRDLRPLSDSFS